MHKDWATVDIEADIIIQRHIAGKTRSVALHPLAKPSTGFVETYAFHELGRKLPKYGNIPGIRRNRFE